MNDKVVIATPFENRLAKRGTRLPELAEMLAARGVDVTYLTTDFSHAYKVHFSSSDIEEQQKREAYDLQVLHVVGYTKNISLRRVANNLLMAISYYRVLGRILDANDTLVLPSRPVELIYIAALLKRKIGCRIVLDIRDVWPDALVGGSKIRNGLFKIYCNFYLRRSLPQFDSFVHIAPSFVNWLHRYSPGAQSTFVPPGFFAGRWLTATPRKLASHGKIRLVYIGALQFQIDIMPVVRALVHHPDISLTVIGEDGNGERYAEVKAFIDKQKMSNVALTGRLEPDLVVDALMEHDIGVVPMITSSIPNKVFDYIACYMPILALGDNDTADFVVENGMGWATEFNADSVNAFLSRISTEEIIEKGNAVTAQREKYDRDTLYQPLIDQILIETSGHAVGPSKSV